MVLKTVMKDPDLLWDPNFTPPVAHVPQLPGALRPLPRQAVSAGHQPSPQPQVPLQWETEGIGPPTGNWIRTRVQQSLRTPEELSRAGV